MGTGDPAAMLFLCSPAQGLLFPTYCHGGWFTTRFYCFGISRLSCFDLPRAAYISCLRVGRMCAIDFVCASEIPRMVEN